jgi:hypothetical protein
VFPYAIASAKGVQTTGRTESAQAAAQVRGGCLSSAHFRSYAPTCNILTYAPACSVLTSLHTVDTLTKRPQHHFGTHARKSGLLS